MNPLKISVVSYLNSSPFIAGLEHFQNQHNYKLSIDLPFQCAEKLISFEADLGLIPVAKIKELPEHFIVSNYCIGALGKVESVVIVSNEPLESLTSVILDRESRTSVLLAKILMRDLWKKEVQWIVEGENNIVNLPSKTGAVLIGNRALLFRSRYKYVVDLAECWQQLTGLPFVFACWVSNKKIDGATIELLNQSFEHGLTQRKNIIELNRNKYPENDLERYLFENIRYQFDEPAKEGLQLFLQKLESLTNQ